MRKLSQDQREALNNLAEDSDGCEAFIFSVENAVLYMEADVLHSPIVAGRENEVLYKKLKAEGARKLLEETKKLLLDRPKPAKS